MNKKQNGNQTRYSIVLKTNVSQIPWNDKVFWHSSPIFTSQRCNWMRALDILHMQWIKKKASTRSVLPSIIKTTRKSSPTFKIPSRFPTFVPALGMSAITLHQWWILNLDLYLLFVLLKSKLQEKLSYLQIDFIF